MLNKTRKHKHHLSLPLRARMIFLVCFVLLTIPASNAFSNNILILKSSNSDYYNKTEAAFLVQLKKLKGNHTITSQVISEVTPKLVTATVANKKIDTILSIGTAATEFAIQKEPPQLPIIATFLSKTASEKILKQAKNRHLEIIYIDQPLSRYIHLANIISPKAKKVGTVFSSISIEKRGNFDTYLASYKKTAVSETLSPDANPLAVISPVVKDSDIFVAIPDQSIVNRSIAKWALYLTFHQKKPLVGFSAAYTRSGAVASLYSSPQNMGTAAAELLQRGITKNNIHSMAYPADFTVSTNNKVAKAIGIAMPTTADLKQQLIDREIKQHD